MAQKLIKVAKEFNVGLHTIVETLHSKGFPIEEKPTADISDEMLIVLQKEFQKDLAIKQEADKLARPVLKKDPISPGVGAPTTTTTTAPPPTARPSLLPPREEAPKVALPKIEEARDVKPAAQKEEPEVIQRERPALRVIGRIDLDAANKTQAPKPEEKKTGGSSSNACGACCTAFTRTGKTRCSTCTGAKTGSRKACSRAGKTR